MLRSHSICPFFPQREADTPVLPASLCSRATRGIAPCALVAKGGRKATFGRVVACLGAPVRALTSYRLLLLGRLAVNSLALFCVRFIAIPDIIESVLWVATALLTLPTIEAAETLKSPACDTISTSQWIYSICIEHFPLLFSGGWSATRYLPGLITRLSLVRCAARGFMRD